MIIVYTNEYNCAYVCTPEGEAKLLSMIFPDNEDLCGLEDALLSEQYEMLTDEQKDIFKGEVFARMEIDDDFVEIIQGSIYITWAYENVIYLTKRSKGREKGERDAHPFFALK